jgi:hypothetical protein
MVGATGFEPVTSTVGAQKEEIAENNGLPQYQSGCKQDGRRR